MPIIQVDSESLEGETMLTNLLTLTGGLFWACLPIGILLARLKRSYRRNPDAFRDGVLTALTVAPCAALATWALVYFGGSR